jgi:Flp pilus assembly protein TadG
MRLLIADRRGVAAVEFALAAPMLITAMLGLFELGSLFSAQEVLAYAVARAARYAAVSSTSATSAGISAAVTTAAAPVIPNCAETCAVSVSYFPSYQVGGQVTVSVTYAWSPLPGEPAIGTLTLSSSMTSTVQN